MSEDQGNALMELTLTVGALLSERLSELATADRVTPPKRTQELRKALDHFAECLRLQGIAVPPEGGNHDK